MLGLAPPQVERLAPPETCGEAICTWQRGERDFAFVGAEEGLNEGCLRGATIIARVTAPEDYVERCALTALMHAPDVAELGGAMIYEDEVGLRIERAWPPHIRRAWTVRGVADQE
jgi:competence protein ComEC